ncbi:mannosyl-oligosaccharide alpha-1,2-mannosidase [Coemansia sp. Benny D115]|nr:mannosyl-oligosaccharide alpha-1,2-mannosidase [Coemansia sp. Benny D115]
MANLQLSRWLGRRTKRMVLVSLIMTLVIFALRRFNLLPFSLTRPHNPPTADPRAEWLQLVYYLPTKEQQDLAQARTNRPSAWASHQPPNWHASHAQHEELNHVYRQALSNPRQSPNPDTDRLWQQRCDRVRSATKYAWDAYHRDVFGSDEYHPISHTGTNHTKRGIGYFIADVLDTLLIMGLKEEYQQGRDFLASHVSFDQRGTVSLFETTIRVLGGLLSAYHWSGESDPVILDLADDLGRRLFHSLNTSTGIPPETAILRSDGSSYAYISSTAEVATLQLEFRYLSKLTGRQDYKQGVDKIMHILFNATKYDGLVPIYVNAQTGQFTGNEIRLGSRGDSYYEYLLKQWLQTRKSEPEYRKQYDLAMEGVKKYLVEVTPTQNLTYIGELASITSARPEFSPKMDHLVCFMGGNLALGATQGVPLSDIPPLSLSALAREDLILARELTETCVHMYMDMPSGLSPEIAHFVTPNTTVNPETRFPKPHGDILNNW